MTDPGKVRPSKWSDVTLLYDDGDFSVITGRYEGGTTPAYGLRWNGDPDNPDDIGDPVISGNPDWFVLPPYLAEPMLHVLLAESLRRPQQERFQKDIFRTIRDNAKRVRPNSIQRAIALYGAANTGKTMTLNLLIDLLDAEAKKTKDAGIIASGPDNYDPATKTGDRCVAIRVFGKLVVVATFVDLGEFVQKGIDFARRFNADILVAATRKRSDSASRETFFDLLAVKAGIPCEHVEKIWIKDPSKAQSQAMCQAVDLLQRIQNA